MCKTGRKFDAPVTSFRDSESSTVVDAASLPMTRVLELKNGIAVEGLWLVIKAYKRNAVTERGTIANRGSSQTSVDRFVGYALWVLFAEIIPSSRQSTYSYGTSLREIYVERLVSKKY